MSKSSSELGKILRDMYNNAPDKEKVTMIHLFGIQYNDEIKQAGLKQVIEEAGINLSYRTELNKGIRLAKYVTPLLLHKG